MNEELQVKIVCNRIIANWKKQSKSRIVLKICLTQMIWYEKLQEMFEKRLQGIDAD